MSLTRTFAGPVRLLGTLAAAATDFLREIAPRHRLDLGRVIALGHSSGGQLALWLGARARLPGSSAPFAPSPLPLRGVVSTTARPTSRSSARSSSASAAAWQTALASVRRLLPAR
jgi:acetyl esterase/lipase